MSNGFKVAVLGGGSFGTAIANIISMNCISMNSVSFRHHRTSLWLRSPERAQECRETRQNKIYLPGYQLDDQLLITSDLKEAVAEAELVFVSIPSHSFRSVTQLIKPLITSNCVVVSTAKGIEPGGGFKLMSQILEEELPGHAIGVLSGPNFAKEIVEQKQTGTVIASNDNRVISLVQDALRSSSFRVYANQDRFGVELSGALKNIYAIVCGMAAALGAGKNTQAMLLTRSLAEMSRFAQVMGANPMTFLGLAGMGDLILTCTSDLSRNYRVGFALGQGKTLDEVMASIGEVAEGINTLRQVKQKVDELKIYMPLVSGLYAILFEKKSIAEVARSLMVGEQADDVEFLRGN
jgi:glycerol-3-phosphate dehydrogenase (NAD(P)+)